MRLCARSKTKEAKKAKEAVGAKPSVRTPVSTYELEDFSKPLDQDAEWITVKPKSSKTQKQQKALTFL